MPTQDVMSHVVISSAVHGIAPQVIAASSGIFTPRGLALALVGALVVFAGVAAYQRNRARRSGIAGIDRMDVKTLEETLVSLFRQLGYSVEGARVHGDFAAELVVAKDGERTVVEGKRWSKHIGVNAVQAAISARSDFACSHAMVVANRPFTTRAKKIAKTNKVELWDREALITRLLKLNGIPEASEWVPVLAAPETGVPAPVVPPGAAMPGADEDGEQMLIGSAPAAAIVQMAATAAPPLAPSTGQPVPTDPDPATGFASCGLCGVSVSDADRTLCLTHRARFGGRVYCAAHQGLFGGAPE